MKVTLVAILWLRPMAQELLWQGWTMPWKWKDAMSQSVAKCRKVSHGNRKDEGNLVGRSTCCFRTFISLDRKKLLNFDSCCSSTPHFLVSNYFAQSRTSNSLGRTRKQLGKVASPNSLSLFAYSIILLVSLLSINHSLILFILYFILNIVYLFSTSFSYLVSFFLFH